MYQVLEAQGSGPTLLILLVVMIAMMYFTGYRPAKKQKEEQEKRKKSLKVGDEIITVGGIKGTVTEIKEGSFIIKSANSGEIEFVMEALSHILEGTEVISDNYQNNDDDTEKTDEKEDTKEKED